MSSMDSYGRPNSIELLVLIDRRYKREIPIEANYCGAKIDTFKGDRVNVVWGENSKDNIIYIVCVATIHDHISIILYLARMLLIDV